jgi:hypothetical protein
MSAIQSTTPPAVEYRTIARYPGYRFGSDGSIWSCIRVGRYPALTDTWRRLRPRPQSSGHLHIWLGRENQCYVHRLILEAFVGPCPPGLEACHGPDPDPSNNRLDNLRWDTRQENQKDRFRHGEKPPFGEDSPSAVLTKEDVLEIVRLRQAGSPILGLAEMFNVHDRTIQAIMYGRSWNSVTGFPKYKPKGHKPGRPRKDRGMGEVSRVAPSDNVSVGKLTQTLLW